MSYKNSKNDLDERLIYLFKFYLYSLNRLRNKGNKSNINISDDKDLNFVVAFDTAFDTLNPKEKDIINEVVYFLPTQTDVYAKQSCINKFFYRVKDCYENM